MSTRQTLGYLRNLFDDRGIKPKNKLGQNFLIDLNLIDLLIRSAEITREDLVLEVGSGTGSLTAAMAGLAGAVVSVEIDTAFSELTSEVVAGMENVTLYHGDILKNKNELEPEVLNLLQAIRDASLHVRRGHIPRQCFSIIFCDAKNEVICDRRKNRGVKITCFL